VSLLASATSGARQKIFRAILLGQRSRRPLPTPPTRHPTVT
jgi:hypothetical protein